jgi:hypothetical protein
MFIVLLETFDPLTREYWYTRKSFLQTFTTFEDVNESLKRKRHNLTKCKLYLIQIFISL